MGIEANASCWTSLNIMAVLPSCWGVILEGFQRGAVKRLLTSAIP